MIQVIERFHKIIEYIARDPETPRTLTELAALIGVSAPACSNILRTMVHLGYLEKAGVRKGYVLGAAPYYLSRKGPYKKYLGDIARPSMEQLVQDIHELVVLVTESGGRRIELLKLESESMIQVRNFDNGTLPDLFRVATGILFLAYKPEEEFRAFWNSRDDAGGGLFHSGDYAAVRSKCARIVADGFFLSDPHRHNQQLDEEDVNACYTMSFPVFEDGKVVAAVGSRVPAFRFKGERREKILQACRNTAETISRAIAGQSR